MINIYMYIYVYKYVYMYTHNMCICIYIYMYCSSSWPRSEADSHGRWSKQHMEGNITTPRNKPPPVRNGLQDGKHT